MLSIIVAVAQEGVIGRNNDLIWHISEDLRHFKAVTSGHPIIMGRKTYESLGRPLPNRTNVVITRRSDLDAEGCTVVGSLEEAIKLFPTTEEVFIIGGGQIYAQAMPLADRFYLTEVEAPFEGDTFFPEWDRAEWEVIEEQRFERGEKFEYPFTFLTLERKAK